MTAQASDWIIIEGVRRSLFCAPLEVLLERRGLLDWFGRYARMWSTANYRHYVATWRIADGRLLLAGMVDAAFPKANPFPAEAIDGFLAQARLPPFPAPARWFTGNLFIPLGRRLLYRHAGWASVFERMRVIRIVRGKVVRDRIVDTKAMLVRRLRRDAAARKYLEGGTNDRGIPGPIAWLEKGVKLDVDPPGDAQRPERASRIMSTKRPKR